ILRARYGLDDWRVQLPLGILVAIPAIENEILILSAETQLVACFVFFCGTAYRLGGDSVAEMLDAKGHAIIAQHNALEDAAIAKFQETVLVHEECIATITDTKGLYQAQLEVSDALTAATTLELQWSIYAETVKSLDAMVSEQEKRKNEVLAGLLADAKVFVAKEMAEKQDIRALLMSEAIAAIADPKAAGKSNTVAGLYKQFFAQVAKDAAQAAK
ncbi:hypothetical protein M885DRAFT_550927, partial [Pelagophyceae sp. CCMP2097]